MKNTNITRAIMGFLVAIGVTAIAFSGSAHAEINQNIDLVEGGLGISISPARTKIDITPGEVAVGEMRVRGTGQDTTTVFAELAPFSVADNTYEQNFSTNTERNEIVRWTSLELIGCTEIQKSDTSSAKIYFELRPQEECFVKYHIDVPDNAPAGSQHAAIFVQSFIDDTANTNSIGIASSHRVGMTMYANNTDGKTDIRGLLVRQSIPFWVFSGPLKTEAIVENGGNLDFEAQVDLEVKNLLGNTVYKGDTSESIIMAETTRDLHSDWNEAGIGVYNVTQKVRFLDNEYEISSWVFMIPLWLLIAILVCLVILVLAIVYGVHKHVSKNKRMRKF